jgi:helix-turn-helix protein
MVSGAVIRARREALGQTLQQVAQATRIPLAHLEAIEDDQLDQLPAGPYAAAYNRALCHHLGLEVSASEDPPTTAITPPQGAPLWVVRAMAIASVVMLALLLLSLLWQRVSPRLSPLALTSHPDQQLAILARHPTKLQVRVDGDTVLDRALKEGEKVSFLGRDTIEVDLRAISDVKLEWNGAVVVPQGRQDVPRTLRFVDDGGVPW